jgi:hypothetical protein
MDSFIKIHAFKERPPVIASLQSTVCASDALCRTSYFREKFFFNTQEDEWPRVSSF